MDARDWGRMIGSTIGSLFFFSIATLLAAWLLANVRLRPWKTALAALIIGHVAAAFLRRGAGAESNWSNLGFLFSRLIGGPLLWIFASKLVTSRRSDLADIGQDTPTKADQQPEGSLGEHAGPSERPPE